MSQESKDEMRPEYDIRGGVRGKYLARYVLARPVTFESPFTFIGSTASITLTAGITRPSYQAPLPSSTIKIG